MEHVWLGINLRNTCKKDDIRKLSDVYDTIEWVINQVELGGVCGKAKSKEILAIFFFAIEQILKITLKSQIKNQKN